MGFFRLLFAFTVVLTHSRPIFGYFFGNPVVAVRAFFIISGFYMALILEGKYASYKSFIISRFLRIYPLYFIILILTVLFSVTMHSLGGSWGEMQVMVTHFKELNAISFLWLFVSNTIVFGRDILMFLDLNPTTGFFVYSMDGFTSIPAQFFLLIPQAWTVILEVLFYLIVPLIIKRKTATIIALMITSIAIRQIILSLGLGGISWNYMFFPSEFIFFASGILAYRLYKKISLDTKKCKKIAIVFSALMIAYLALYNYINLDVPLNVKMLSIIPPKEILFYFIFILSLPFVFILSSRNLIDRKIGELSYPVYITHILILAAIYPVIFNHLNLNSNLLGPISFILAVILSLLLNKVVQEPIDKYRHKKLLSGKGAPQS
jgi:peptidoglycan/LPS O-acetylase OafA/YrhL